MSSCSGKIRFQSKRKARNGARLAFAEFDKRLYVYPCSACKGWHLTSMKRSTFRRLFRDQTEGDDA